MLLRKCKKTLQKLLVPEILACPLPRRRAVVNLEKIKEHVGEIKRMQMVKMILQTVLQSEKYLHGPYDR